MYANVCACEYEYDCERYDMFPYGKYSMVWYEGLLVLGGYVGGVRSLSGLVSLLPSFPLGLVFIDGIILDCYVCVSECRCVSGDEWLVVVGYP